MRGGGTGMARIDTRAVGLDAGVALVRWLTGAENLHYGLWDGLEVTAGNLRAAQEAYSARLLAHLPEGKLRILDIGGGAGETARALVARGHRVEIVVPSAFLAARCRANAPQAAVHACRFQDFAGAGPYDLCLWSESFQYVGLRDGLPRCLPLLAPGGRVLIADCFRSDAHDPAGGRKPGGGHSLAAFRALLSTLPLRVLAEEDITDGVAPSIDLEQGFFNVLGHAVTRAGTEVRAKRPGLAWVAGRLARLVSARKRKALMARLTAQERTAEVFRRHNRYLILSLQKT